MCEYSRRLIAWMDREVPADEAGEIERHVAACAECRGCVAEFERASREFNAYCDALAQSKGSGAALCRERLLWVAAASIMLAALLVYPRRHALPAAEQPSLTAAASVDSRPSVRTSAVGRVPPPFPRDRRTARRPAATRAAGRTASSRPCVTRDCVAARVEGATKASAPSTAAQNANWITNEASVQIAIPAAAMFPPGAVPEGVDFVADLSIGADGSVQQVRLQPQISEFERRSTQP